MEKLKFNQSGFAMLEVSFVLVMVTLILGGVWKGQELINIAMVKDLESDFKNIPSFIYSYQDKYKAVPGDDLDVVNHVGGILAATPSGLRDNGVIDGNWNSTTVTDESFLFWQHVRLAGLTSGSTTITAPAYLPVNAAGGVIGVQGGTAIASNSPINGGLGQNHPIRGTYIMCSAGILGKYAKVLDLNLDDGNTATGSMMATPASGYTMGSAVATATAAIDDEAPYIVCMGI